MKNLEQVLSDTHSNHILPFFWMHGEQHDILKEEIEKVYDCGIRAICVEARPHPDFCKDGWWADMDLIMDEARKRDMKVWILDDKKFPTGFANGYFQTKYPEKSKLYLAERHMDIMGPCDNSAVLVKPFMPADATLLGVFAYPKPDTECLDIVSDGAINLTNTLGENGFVYFSLPEGAYRLFIIFTTHTGGGRADYMNIIDHESVGVLIEAVYQPHYDRYKDDFGKTFAGFFSDEPELGNTPGYNFNDSLGTPDIKLPWSRQLEKKLFAQWNNDFVKNLPALWFNVGEETQKLRYQYMDSLTRLTAECFTVQVGSWCQKHGVEYIGHVIEDDNAHTKLGCSVGHYFREHTGRHMGGIDVVHFQILPGFSGKVHRWLSWETDSEFFHFGLAKLGSSAGHIDANKKGRSMCEIFGNYGWAENIPVMKWLTDHMLVRGINNFVPHAFSSKDFPDRDCPPHFYARGNNPQFHFFKHLMKYMNRAASLLSDGEYKVDAAVLYHAESEWFGKTMKFQKPVRALLENQLDCDVIPADALSSTRSAIHNSKLILNKHSYPCLIVPFCEAIPSSAVSFIEKAHISNFPVFFIEKRPIYSCDGNALSAEFSHIGEIINLSELAKYVREISTPEIKAEQYLPNLRFCCVEQPDGKVYMFFNEDVLHNAKTKIQLLNETCDALSVYDPVGNDTKLQKIVGNTFDIDLKPGESLFLLTDTLAAEEYMGELCKSVVMDINWQISKCSTNEYPSYLPCCEIAAGEKLPNLNSPAYFPEFTGHFKYDGIFSTNINEKIYISFPQISDAADIKINSVYAGTILGNSGKLDISSFVQSGENSIEIETANTLVWAIKDCASTHLQIMATGLCKPPVLEYYK